MTEADQKADSSPPKGWRFGSVWSFTFILLALYILSPAPIVKVFGMSPPKVILVIYVPLEVLASNVPAVESFYVWYFNLWGIK